MGMKAQKHIHQYYQMKKSIGVGPLRMRAQWACGLPDCTHFLPLNMPEPLGKLSRCHNCMEEFMLEEEHLKQEKPICNECASGSVKFPDNLNWERMEARGIIAKNENKTLEEVTELEIDKLIERKRNMFR